MVNIDELRKRVAALMEETWIDNGQFVDAYGKTMEEMNVRELSGALRALESYKLDEGE